jgi:protein TonB
MTSWSDSRTEKAKFEKPKIDPLLVQLNFTQPAPKTVQQKPIEEKALKQPPKPKPKTKPKVTPKKKLVKRKKPPQKKSPVQQPVTKPVRPSQPVQVAQPSPPKAQPTAKLLEIYLAEILSSIEKKKRYPTLARRKNIEGKVNVSFKLSCGGDISELQIQGAHGLLRKAAKKAIKAAQPFPKRPEELDCPLPVTYAMAYSLKQ